MAASVLPDAGPSSVGYVARDLRFQATGSPVLTEAGTTVRLRDGREHVLIYWALLGPWVGWGSGDETAGRARG